jgi:hypothetical protein
MPAAHHRRSAVARNDLSGRQRLAFITVVLADAPDRWVKEDFLTDEQQLNLE